MGVEREIVCGLYFFLYSFLLKIYVWAQILCVYYKKVRLTCVLCAEMWWFLLLQTTNFIQCLVKVVNLLIRCRGFNLLEHNLIDDSHRWYFCVHSRRENRHVSELMWWLCIIWWWARRTNSDLTRSSKSKSCGL
jgi:hypothetical protein